MSKIIVGTDFSEQGILAVETGVNWANQLHKDLLVLNVINSYSNTYTLPKEFDLEKFEHDRINNYKKESLEKIDLKDLNESQLEIIRGDPSKEILKASNAPSIELIILGGKGHGTLHNFLLGSNTTKIVRGSKRPVLIVKDRRALHPKKLLVCIDIKFFSDNILKYVLALSKEQNIKVTFLHIVDAETVKEMTDENPKILSKVQSMDDLLEMAHVWAKDKFNKTITQINQSGIDAELEVEVSKDTYPTSKILETAKLIQPDILVTGTHGKKDLENLIFLGSVAEKLINSYEGSLLVMKGQGKQLEKDIVKIKS